MNDKLFKPTPQDFAIALAFNDFCSKLMKEHKLTIVQILTSISSALAALLVDVSKEEFLDSNIKLLSKVYLSAAEFFSQVKKETKYHGDNK